MWLRRDRESLERLRNLGEGKGTVMMIIENNASVKGMYEIDPKTIDSGKGLASAPFRVYKAYLVLRATVSCERAWREANVPLIGQVMSNLFKGKSALQAGEGPRGDPRLPQSVSPAGEIES